MELRKLIPALPLTLLLAVSSCTADPDPEPQPTAEQELRLATENTGMYRALGAVYAAELEEQGYRVSVLEPVNNPVAQLLDGHADLAIGSGTEYLQTLSDDPGATTDEVLSREEIASLLVKSEETEFAAVEISPGDMGQLLVMSAAQMTLTEVSNLQELLNACADLEFAALPAAQSALKNALEQAQCEPTQVLTDQATDPAELLRRGEVQAAVLSGTRALINDEGFVPVPDSAALFPSEPVLGFLAAQSEPQVLNTVAEVTAALNNETLTAVNRLVEDPDPAAPEDVARHWQWLSQ